MDWEKMKWNDSGISKEEFPSRGERCTAVFGPTRLEKMGLVTVLDSQRDGT